jgi:AraC family transcriptional regulator
VQYRKQYLDAIGLVPRSALRTTPVKKELMMVKKLAPGSFFGRTERRYRVGDIVVVESVYPSGPSIPTHEHASSFFDLVVAGACEEAIGGLSRVRDRSSLAFHPAGERHSSRWHGRESRCFHIEVPDSLLERVKQLSSIQEYPALWSGGTPVWLATRLYNEFWLMDETSPLAIEGLTLELLAVCLRDAPAGTGCSPPRWMKSVLDLLKERFSERLSLATVADSVGVHPAHLARVFRRLHEETVGDHMRRLRVEFACECLRTSNTPLVEIALSAGYADQSHFSRAFKREMGLSPAEFRDSVRPRKSGSIGGSNRTRA